MEGSSFEKLPQRREQRKPTGIFSSSLSIMGICLVVEPTPLKKYVCQNANLPQIGMNIKNI